MAEKYYLNRDLENIIYFDELGLEKEESWKNVVNFEGLYGVSDLGRVKSLKRPYVKKDCILSQYLDKDGYCCLVLHKNRPYSKKVHRLVGESFVENIDNLPQINHKDGIPYANIKGNLEWVDNRGNQKHKKEILSASTLPIGVRVSRKKFVSSIQIEGVSYRLYHGKSVEDASNAYEKALLNFSADGTFPKPYRPDRLKYKGIYKDKKSNKYFYQIRDIHNKTKSKFGFDTKEDALKAKEEYLENKI